MHELIRLHSMQAGKRVKEEGKSNDLLERIKNDDNFKAVHNKLNEILSPDKYIGRADAQVEEFISSSITPILEMNADFITQKGEINL